MAAREGTLEKEKGVQREFCRFGEEAATLLLRSCGGEGEEEEREKRKMKYEVERIGGL